ncbi:capsule biosynthesis protein [Rhizobiaceae bacterium BDR2-2]|uniref:Capsule biosynthesis protein n=1 Tax=Ectorhizobium quercum TaxID=2965071 RepID=A0AAE3N0Z9_9HYPH|nr:capsule biosynthesis protein [Ectorhizobium quercum]MCX8996203.1 capsule biosynthesis protein [Ectorhizobium quercum]MCX8998758.1 capsule biosynthesis protein [Ectorhizobium quercum]
MTNLDQDIRKPSALEKSRQAAKALSATARKLRFSTSNRSDLYKAVGLRPRLIDRVFRWAFMINTLVVLILPVIASFLYFGVIASDQYRSETRFVVRTSTPAIGTDQLGKVTGLPSAKIVQDTQIVTNFIHSRSMLEELEEAMDLRSRFMRPDIDRPARLKPDATYEELLDYWDGMVKTSISPSSGIITVTVNAFSAEDARDIATEITRSSERMINQLSDRIWQDVTGTAKVNLDRATEKLQEVRARVASQQNESGVLTVESSSLMLSSLLTKLQQEKIALEQSYAVRLESIARTAPQMKVLAREIESKQAQIEDLQRQIASPDAGEGKNLASVSAQLSNLQFETRLAEEQFAASVRTFEQVQFMSKQQLMYLDSFLPPSLPDDALFPRRGLWMGMTVLGSFFLWLAMTGIMKLVKSKVDV